MAIFGVLFWLLIVIILQAKNRITKLERKLDMIGKRRRGFNFALEYQYACEEYAKLETIARAEPYCIPTPLCVYNDDHYDVYQKEFKKIVSSTDHRMLTYHEWWIAKEQYCKLIDEFYKDQHISIKLWNKSMPFINQARLRMVNELYLPDNWPHSWTGDLVQYDLRYMTRCEEALNLMKQHIQTTPDPEVCKELKRIQKKYSFDVQT